MRLIKCHIENFGKLSQFDYEFNETKNVILKDNGWGKSTFAAFIKVMFYGFENPKKTNAYENERKRFSPWNGGVYGGTISFEVGEKSYILTRTFGQKERDDSFSLLDASTMLESLDYTTNIGEEIFNINRESFKNTIFVGQDSCETRSTGDIENLLGNVTLESLDINNYDNAINTLNDYINKYSPTRKTGELNKIKRQLDDLEFENLTINSNKQRVEKLINRSKVLEDYLNLERKKKDKYQNRIFIELDKKKDEEENTEKEEKKPEKDEISLDKYDPNAKTDVVGLFILLFGFFLTVLGVFLQNNGKYSTFAYPITGIGLLVMVYYVSKTFFKVKEKEANKKEEDEKKKKEEALKKEQEEKEEALKNAPYDPFKEPEDAEFANAPNKYREYVRNLKLSESRIDDYTGELNRINREIDELNKEIAKQEENDYKKAKLQEYYNELTIKYDYTKKAKDFLTRAKENFGKKYNEPVKKTFDKYLSMMLDSTDDFVLNVNNELAIKNASGIKDVKMLSKAFRDVIGLSLRLAFIECSFKKEKPFIILDDCFVNVDDNTLAPCMNMLNTISKEYQIIYFTCSISRT